MRRLELLISQARQESDNTTFADDAGLQDSEFIRWGGRAQNVLLLAIQKKKPDILLDEVISSVAVGDLGIDMPARTLLSSRIRRVEFARASTGDYFPLKKGQLYERFGNDRGTPTYYIRKDQRLLFQQPSDTTGTVRATIEKKLPRLDIRRAQVSAVTLDTSARTITDLTFDSTLDIDKETLEAQGYFSVVDKSGAILMAEVPIDSVDQTTGVVVVTPGFVYAEGETLPVGAYICAGPFASNVSQLDDICEDFIVEYMIFRAGIRDSSTDTPELSDDLKEMISEILDSYAEPDGDVDFVPVLDAQYLTADD